VGELVDAALLLVAVVLVQTVPAVEVWKTHAPVSARWRT